ncbi:hypothetical protein ASG52_19370 [Methylobacterium sp. Leaf456]|uniref:GumC family protein n=1 Tax=Methylobacterium sp. Leaf456 TaxID=1736382 RepID=UPI0006FCCA19|nr:GumC family protein [Methylobacterium sp. Leaf456]KQT59901.1 hypothetical protein ASG52_19370 [Methylobacterium sp. Leaf456]
MDDLTSRRIPPPFGQTVRFLPGDLPQRMAPASAIVRRFLAGFFLVLCVAAVAWPFLPRRYEAAGSVILRPTDREGQSDSALSMRQPLDDNAVQSEMDLVSATSVLDAVIARHAIADDPEFARPPLLARLGWVPDPVAPTDAELREAVRRHLVVARDRRSYTLRVGFWSADPAKAEAIAQTLVSTYLSDQVARKRRAAEALFQWLELRVGLIRARQQASTQAVEDYMARSGLVDRGDQISLDAQLVTLSQEAALAKARAIELTTRAGTLAALQAANGLDGAPEVLASTTIQALKQSLSNALGRTVVMSPEQRAVTEQIAAESNRIVRSAAAEAENWNRREAALQGQIRAIRATLTERQRATMVLERLQQEAASDRTALADALTRMKGQTASGGAQRTDVEVVSRPETPRDPAFPSLPLYGLGTLLAACLAGAAMNGRRLLGRARRFLEL